MKKLLYVPLALSVGLGMVVLWVILVGTHSSAPVQLALAEEPSARQAPAKEDAPPARAPQKVIKAFNLGGCGGCHVIPGVPGADGDVGPDLSQLGAVAGKRRKDYSARKYIRESIVDPDAFIALDGTEKEFPSGVMLKSFAESLGKDDLNLIVDYLASLGTDQSPKPSQEDQEKPLSLELPKESLRESFEPLPGSAPPAAKIALGRYLFFDRRLSANNSRSCASCHQPENAFTDGRPLSKGYPSTKLFRNTPSLWNVGYQKTFFWDGRIGDLPSVVRDHLTEAHFMASDGRLLVERLRQVPAYAEAFDEVYGDDPSFGKILDAVSAYVQSLNSPRTAYDRYRNGQQDALSKEALAGLKLFRGKAGCVRCHQEPLLADHSFHNLDVAESSDQLADPERQITFRRFFRTLGTPNYRNLRHDPGRGSVTLASGDQGKFRTPSLREVARTAPYMHNGSLETLEEVVRFYNHGGGELQTAGLKSLQLTDDEVQQIVAFLKSLSSSTVEMQEAESPDYAVLSLGQDEPAEDGVGGEQKSHPPSQEISPKKFPPLAALPEVPAPADNPVTKAKSELGKLLFFDPRMSADGSTSCHSCHAMRTGGTIRTPVSMGGPGTSHWRNSQTILNVAYYGKLNWDGAKSSIESQNEGAWTGAVAGNLDPTLGEERLAQIPEYVRQFHKVFGTDLPRWDDALRAVATFQRTLVSRDTPFDRYLNGDESAISESARRGHKLFGGKANCIACHNGPLGSDDDYHALGVPQHPDFSESPLKQITFRYELASKGVPREVYRTARTDDGLYYVSKREVDRGKFRTPSLRGLVHTAPYMHNGVLETLEDVVAFYNHGGGEHPNKSLLIRPLELTELEQADLVEFLKTLSGKPLEISRPELPKYDRSEKTSDSQDR